MKSGSPQSDKESVVFDLFGRFAGRTIGGTLTCVVGIRHSLCLLIIIMQEETDIQQLQQKLGARNYA